MQNGREDERNQRVACRYDDELQVIVYIEYIAVKYSDKHNIMVFCSKILYDRVSLAATRSHISDFGAQPIFHKEFILF